ncbi:MAG: Sucrose phosphorylase (EC [uncultured Thiotrichaceae bacterium]|uniref:Sucrose phosphorylase (EC) n=1 Tax=uncultured Thiotrichaceae bacterium TaxID=298394 RepID=A0A6S6UCE2_9GAMM|nr:MAG: Sucrose phosphorylase (EC [uncultured Thiotrichaceae bacterium]
MNQSQAEYNPVCRMLAERIAPLVAALYPDADQQDLVARFIEVSGINEAEVEAPVVHQSHWDERDIMVITYGDSVVSPAEKPLQTLKALLDRYLRDSVTMVHILPYYPYSSDGGFAVTDYESINPVLGDWGDVTAISHDYRIMADLVINHCSSEHEWFKSFQRGEPDYQGFFMEASPDDDLSRVVRPRTSPLLRAVQTPHGEKFVWCTFSHDQIDLNFANPAVFLEVMRLISFYIDQGATIFRLDAIGFLWKTIGTSCIHLPETHQAVQLMRTLIEHRQPDAIIITETNVPKKENLSYFGESNEAHLVYNFSLPPLLLNALMTGSAKHLRTWLMSMRPAIMGTTYLNFIASHDGIGVRPVEGILSTDEIDELIRVTQSFGGEVSWRTGPDGEQNPYEINIALFDAFKGTNKGEDHYQIERMLCAHAITIAMEGVPAIYIHSFFATENDYEALESTQHNRDINRHQWEADLLSRQLDDPLTHHAKVMSGLNRLLQIRKQHAAFHPNAPQLTLQLPDALFGFWRQSLIRDQSIFVINNVTDQTQTLALSTLNLIDINEWRELLTDDVLTDLQGEMELAPYQSVWISNRWWAVS